MSHTDAVASPWLRRACFVALLGLPFTVWSVLGHGALPMVAGMGLGQGLGLVALAIFVTAVVRDLTRR